MAKKSSKKRKRKTTGTAGSIMGASSYKAWSKQIGPLKKRKKKR